MSDTVHHVDRPAPRFRPLLLAAVTFAVATLAIASWSARSEAAVYCAVTVIQSGCDSATTNLQTALDRAENNPGHDTVRIFIGDYTGNFTYNNTDAGNTVDIVGAGHSVTKILLGSTLGSGTGLDLNAPAGSTISKLQVEIPENEDGNTDFGLGLSPGTSADLIIIKGDQAENATGIACSACSLSRTQIDLPRNRDLNNFGAVGTGGDISMVETYLGAATALQQNDPAGTATLVRGRLNGVTGARSEAGGIDLQDTLITLSDEQNAIGVHLENAGAGEHVIHGSLDGVTIVGGGEDSEGLRAVADNGTEGAVVDVSNTVISGPTHALFLRAAEDRNVTVDTEYSAYADATTSNATGPNGGTVDYEIGVGHVNLVGDPGFIDPVFVNYTPGGSSPLVDAGDPADPETGALDYLGSPRACHGNGGVIRRDIGAFERKVHPEDDCTYPETTITDGPEPYPTAMYTGHSIWFNLASSKPGSTFRCSIDDGAFMPCGPSFTQDDLSFGLHTFRASAIDQFGNIDQTPVTRDFYLTMPKAPPPRCETVPALCPKPDRTAPRVIGLKAPKKTKLKRVKVRFKSNEKGSTFKCRLNGGKWKKCKPPWKTPKLKKGKNTVRIQATDKAGNRSMVVKRVIRRK